ncbi:MAG: exo-alpha-sialidase, partial [Thaumarchaeota archaeon]|nr:exo-alpha-sialidase [Nitrososphaerota archaeon]
MKTLNLYISVMLFAVTLFFVTEHQATALYATYSRISSTVASGNNVYVTWDDSDGNNTYILFRKSQDGGDTFGKSTVIASNVGVAITTRVAVSSNNVYVAWADDPQKGTPHVYIRTSSDYGNTFGNKSV